MSDHPLTAGAERVLEEVAARALDPGASLFGLLLAVLAEHEGRAAEILREFEVSVPELEESASSGAVRDPVETSAWRRQIVRSADQQAILLSSERATGTEHLLLAALELDEASARHAGASGLTLASLQSRLRNEEPEPDLQLHDVIQVRSAEPGAMETAALHRILDASANRCREGLRVVEDFIRFDLSDALLSAEIKGIRHALTAALNHLGQSNWIACRDAAEDVGPLANLASERFRGAMIDVVRASLKRTEEALRSLEEYGKLIDTEMSRRISECRYRFYTLEQAVESVVRSRARLADARLYLLVTGKLCRYGAETVIRNTVDAGVDVVQIREKEFSDRELIDFALQVREWTAAAGALLIINDRPDIAAMTGADGVHLGQEDARVSEARRIVGGRALIGVSTHSLEQARKAVFAGADYLGVGPVFQSGTKEFSSFAGLDYVREAARNVSLPWFAIGGITPENLPAVQAAGARRIAVSGAVCGAAHPRGISRDFAAKLATGPSIAGESELIPED